MLRLNKLSGPGQGQPADLLELQRAKTPPHPSTLPGLEKGPKVSRDADVFQIAAPAAVALQTGKKARRLIGVYGGSFDPVTDGHLSCIEMLAGSYRHREQRVVNGKKVNVARPLDELLVVPNDKHWKPEKRSGRAPYEDRIQMLELAIANLEDQPAMVPMHRRASKIKISRADREAGGTSHPVKRIKHIAQQNPDADLIIFFGSDMKKEVESWPDLGELEKYAEVVFLERPGYAIDDAVKMASKLSVSSTEIRKALVADDVDSIRGKIDADVLDYLLARPDILERYRERHKDVLAAKQKAA